MRSTSNGAIRLRINILTRSQMLLGTRITTTKVSACLFEWRDSNDDMPDWRRQKSLSIFLTHFIAWLKFNSHVKPRCSINQNSYCADTGKICLLVRVFWLYQ